MNYTLPEPYSACIDADWTTIQLYSATQMREAFAAGQRDMREKAANVCADLEYTGWDGEYMKYGPETDANQEFRKCAAVIRALPINAKLPGLAGVSAE